MSDHTKTVLTCCVACIISMGLLVILDAPDWATFFFPYMVYASLYYGQLAISRLNELLDRHE